MMTRRERSIICLIDSQISCGMIVADALPSLTSAILTKRSAAAPVSTGIDFIVIAMRIYLRIYFCFILIGFQCKINVFT